MRATNGFTLLELTISMAMLAVVSMLTFVVTQSSTSAAAIAEAKESAQASVRDLMTTMVAELQLACKKSNPALEPPLQALAVVNPSEIVFQMPANETATVYTAPITYRLINEDGGTHTGAGNARLDPGEDTDHDGALTRRVVRIQGGVQTPLASANDVSFVQFSLNPPVNDILTITVMATKSPQTRRHDLISATATSRVYLMN